MSAFGSDWRARSTLRVRRISRFSRCRRSRRSEVPSESSRAPPRPPRPTQTPAPARRVLVATKKIARIQPKPPKMAHRPTRTDPIRRDKSAKVGFDDDPSTLKSIDADAPSGPAGEIFRLQTQADELTRRTEMEKRRTKDVEAGIERVRAKIIEQRREMGGVDAAQEKNTHIQRSLKMLENRLDKALGKYNDALAHNRQLRGTIDNLRKERVLFDDIYKKLEHELAEKKNRMGEIIERSDKAYEARDKAVSEMAKLKQQADKEQLAFEKEWRELTKLIEHDKKMRAFMKNKAKAQGAAEEARLAAEADEEERKQKKRDMAGKWAQGKSKADAKKSQARVQSYREAFKQIQEATGIGDIEELVNSFMQAEDENFRLFNYVNTLNAEIERLEEQISECKHEIEKYKGSGAANDSQRRKLLKDLEDKLARTEAKAKSYDGKYKTATATVSTLREGIWKVYNKIGCNTPANAELLGGDGVTDGNMMQYLGIIEQRTNEILQMYAASMMAQGGSNTNAADYDSFVQMTKTGPDTAAGPRELKIEAPSTEDPDDDQAGSDEEHPEDRPLDRDELKRRAVKQLARREMGDGVSAVVDAKGPGAKKSAGKGPAKRR